MALVGDFTPADATDAQADPDEFTCFGETFEIPATVGAFAVLRYASLMKGAIAQEKRGDVAKRRALSEDAKLAAERETTMANISAQAAIYELLRACLGDGQIDRFGELADSNGVTTDGLMDVAADIQAVIAERPTRRSSDSSDGRSMSGPTSTGAGSGPTGMTERERQVAAIEAESISLAGSLA